MPEASVNQTIATKPNDVPVRADWATLGVVSGYAPCAADDVRMVVDGPEGEGKSTFVNSISSALILDFDKGSSGIVGPKSQRVKVLGYDHYQKLIAKALDDVAKNTRCFKRIVFDSADRWIEMVAIQLAKEKSSPPDKIVEDIGEYGSMGSGWRLLRNRCWYAVQELESAGYSWIIVGHLSEKTIVDPRTMKDITVPRLAIFETLRGPIVQSCEIHATVFRLHSEEQPEEEVTLPNGTKFKRPKPGAAKAIETYYFDCSSVAGRQGKKRGVPQMKKRFELPLVGGWDAFVKEYNEAVEKEKNAMK
jgi:hypothetical protein